jgi:acyl carrier protein
MQNAEIYDRLTAIFRDVLDDDALMLKPDLTASDVPAWDSFNHINIVVATEAAFGIKFRSAEIEELKNVGEFVALIRARAD